MNMTFVTLSIAALATWEIIEIWRHSSLMAKWRAITETWDNFFGRVLHCAFCLTPWVSWFVCLIVVVPVPAWDGTLATIAVPIVTLSQFVVLGFAVARLANIGNDLTRDKCRTPNSDAMTEDTVETVVSDVDADDAKILETLFAKYSRNTEKS